MKRLLILLLIVLAITISIATYNSVLHTETGPQSTTTPTNESTETGSTEEWGPIEETKPEIPKIHYESEDLKWLDTEKYIEYQGKINDVFTCGGANMAFQVDNVLHCEEIAGWNKRWSRWTCDHDETIVFFDNSTLVTMNQSGQMKAYIKYGWDVSTHEYGLPRVAIPGLESQFVYGYNPDGENNYTYVYIYEENSALYYIYYDLPNDTSTEPMRLVCKIEDATLPVESFCVNEFGTKWAVIVRGGRMYNVDCTISTNNNEALVVANSEMYIENVNGILATTKSGEFVSLRGDDQNVWYFPLANIEVETDAVKETILTYGSPVKATLPSGYTVKNIERVDIGDNIMLVFDDGVCAIANNKDFKTPSESIEFTKVKALETLAADGGLIKVMQVKNKVIALMDDGHVYEVAQ